MSEFVFKSVGGKMDFGSEYNTARFRQYLKDTDGEWSEIKKRDKIVSDEMRGYMFGACIPFLKQISPSSWTGLTNKQIYEVLKKNFNYFEATNPLTGRLERYGQSVMNKSIKSKKGSEFIHRIDEWVTEQYGQTLPDTEEWKKFVRDNPQLIIEE